MGTLGSLTHGGRGTMSSKGNNETGINKHNAVLTKEDRLKKLENDIYDFFGSIDRTETSIASILSYINLGILGGNYRKIKYSYESLLKALILKELKGFRFQTQLIRYLQNNKTEAKKLGLKKIPDQRTISYFVSHILDKKSREISNFIIKKINEVSDKFSINLDKEILTIERPKKKTSSRNFYNNRNKKTREVCRFTKKKLLPFLKLHQHDNAMFTKKDIIDLIIKVGLERKCAEDISNTLRHTGHRVPQADTLLYHLKKYQSIKEIQNMFITLFEIVWETARKANLFRRKVDIAVDFTEWYFYGDPNASMVVGKKPDRGATHCYKFATINIVEAEERFTLLALPVGPFDKTADILRRLLTYARQRIKIRKVYADRGFFSGECIQVFYSFGLKFLMPATQFTNVKAILKIMPTPTVINDFKMASAIFNLVIIKGKDGKKLSFSTNENYNEKDLGFPQRLRTLYGKRWGIETSYRVKKGLRPLTTSKNYFIRLFYFLFSCLLYNLWIIADILICISIVGIKKEKHIVTAWFFGNFLLDSDYG